MSASSSDLHPKQGARFVMLRELETPAPRYRVEVYLPEALRLDGELAWNEAGRSELSWSSELPAAHAWVDEGAHKLARVLHRDPKERLVRWREAPEA